MFSWQINKQSITKLATLIPIGIAVYLTNRGFNGRGMPVELTIMLTVLFAAMSWLLAHGFSRYLQVRKVNPAMGHTVLGLCAVFVLVEATQTHVGIVWLAQQGNFDTETWPAYIALWIFSFGLSAVNFLAEWAFCSVPGAVRKAAPAQTARPQRAPTEQDQKTLQLIGAQIDAA